MGESPEALVRGRVAASYLALELAEEALGLVERGLSR
jgi:hypothetical protein